MSITTSSNFLVNAQLPCDDKIIKADITARDAIPNIQRYAGMIVTVQSTPPVSYILHAPLTNDDWHPYGGGSVTLLGSPNAVPFVDVADTSLLRTSVNFTRSPTTGVVRVNEGITAAYNTDTVRYVNIATGSNSNNGLLVDPYKTVDYAITQCLNAGPGRYVINVAAGTYSDFSAIIPDYVGKQDSGTFGSSEIAIIGDETTPGNVIFSGSSTMFVHCSSNVSLLIAGVKFQGADGNSPAIACTRNAKLYLRNIVADHYKNRFCTLDNSSLTIIDGALDTVFSNSNTLFDAKNNSIIYSNNKIIVSSASNTYPTIPFRLENSILISYGSITASAFPVSGSGYFVDAYHSYVLFASGTYTFDTLTGPYRCNYGSQIITASFCAFEMVGGYNLGEIRGKSIVDDSNGVTWHTDAVRNGLIVSSGGQIKSNNILQVGVLLTDYLVEYISFQTDYAYTRYSYDERYCEKVGFTMLGELPKNLSAAGIGPAGITSDDQILYTAETACRIVEIRVRTKNANGTGGTTDNYAVYVNGVASTLSVNVVDTNAASNTGAVNLAIGDRVTIVVTSAVATVADNINIQLKIRPI